MPSQLSSIDAQDREGEHVAEGMGLYFWLGADAHDVAVAWMDRVARDMFSPGGRFGRPTGWLVGDGA